MAHFVTKELSGSCTLGPQQPKKRCAAKEMRIVENISFSWAWATFGNFSASFGNLGVGISQAKRTVVKNRHQEGHGDESNGINETSACIGPGGLSEIFSKAQVSEKRTGPEREANPIRKEGSTFGSFRKLWELSCLLASTRAFPKISCTWRAINILEGVDDFRKLFGRPWNRLAAPPPDKWDPQPSCDTAASLPITWASNCPSRRVGATGNTDVTQAA